MEPDIPPPTYEEAISGETETQTSGENNTSVQHIDDINPSLTNNIIGTQPLADTTTYEETTGETHTPLCENNTSVQHIDDINPSLTNNYIINTQPLPDTSTYEKTTGETSQTSGENNTSGIIDTQPVDDTPTTHQHQPRIVNYNVVERPSRYHSRNAMIINNHSGASTGTNLDCTSGNILACACCDCLCDCSESTETCTDLDCTTEDILDCCELLCQCCAVVLCCFIHVLDVDNN